MVTTFGTGTVVTTPGTVRTAGTISTEAKFHRSLVDLEEDRYDEAIAELREVVRLEPDIASGHLELGRALVHRGRRYEGLTPEGDRLVGWARRVLAERDTLLGELRSGPGRFHHAWRPS